MGLFSVVWRTLVDFGKECSIAGLNNAAKAKSVLRSIVWLIIFIVGLGATLRGLILVVKEYYTYPVLTNTVLTQAKSVEFPAITVCNLNM